MYQQLKSTGYRTRSTAIPPCPKHTNIRKFELPQAFCINSSNEQFLIHDSADPHRIIVFASKKSLNYLGMYIDKSINKRCDQKIILIKCHIDMIFTLIKIFR